MKLSLGIVLFLIVTGAFFIVPYYLTDKFRKNKISKYIPSLLCLISILSLYIKSVFFRVGYSNIADVVFIILFTISFVVFFLSALLFKVKKN